MKQTFIRLNNNEKHLSLGNFCRIVKEISVNKSFAGQPEIFYALFEDDVISDSAVNNYCIGYREIGKKFKNIYLKYQKEYNNNPNILDKQICNIISILEGKFENNRIIIDSNNHLKKLCLSLYNLSKNDISVPKGFSQSIYQYIKNNELKKAFSEIIFFIIIEKKQPIYVDSVNKEILENLLNNTDISINELTNFLKLQLNDGINYFYSIKKLAKEENPYACFELGKMEYSGEMVGYPRYIKAFEYLKIAANKNHPRANWLIAQMFLYQKLGNNRDEDLITAFEYLKKAEELGNVAAINTIGIFYLNGYVPNHPKDEETAIKYFEKASDFEYVYAYNNLGKIYENKKNYKKAFEYYLISANLEESWACNKIGEFYRQGIGSEKDIEKAFHYYTLALNVPSYTLEYWAMFNLAKYFYLNGCHYINLEADKEKAMKLLEDAANHGIHEAFEEIIYILLSEYQKTKNETLINKINNYLEKLSLTPYYDKCKITLEKKLLELQKKETLYITKK